jgi:phytanoyl-CoA hydroxylase
VNQDGQSKDEFLQDCADDDQNQSLQQQNEDPKTPALDKSWPRHAHYPRRPFKINTLFQGQSPLSAELGLEGSPCRTASPCTYARIQRSVGRSIRTRYSTFLFTEPRQSCSGLWLALDDATLLNGCLRVRPKSHHEPGASAIQTQTKLHYTSSH